MSAARIVDSRITVETPEGVDFRFVVAGPGKRCVAYAVDCLLKAAVLVIGAYASLAAAAIGGLSQFGTGMILLLWFVVSWLYGACFEAFLNGQTPGKLSQGLRVVRTNGTPIGWFEAFGRNLLLVADGFPVYGWIPFNTVGLLTMAATRRMQRLGDLVFDTMVIDQAREFISRDSRVSDDVDVLPRSECAGRYHVPDRTLAVIERLFEGKRVIGDARREEVARTLSLALRTRLGWEEQPPDERNPNAWFVSSSRRHTEFLKRILKTFTDDATLCHVGGPETGGPKVGGPEVGGPETSGDAV
ncbi:MAG: RDD family protein [Planctomycetaceae bacterium]